MENFNNSIRYFICPEGWDLKKIGEIIVFSGGNQPPLTTFKYEEHKDYIRLIQIRDYRTDKYKTYIPKNFAKKTCDVTDIMIGRYGPPLFQIFRGIKGAYNVALIKAIPNEKIIHKDYCYYFLTRPELKKYLESLSQRSGGQTGIEMDRLNKYLIPVPPISEQEKIIEILNKCDEAIERQSQLISQLEKRKRGLMQQLLTGKKRLSGFKEEWEKLKIKEVSEEVNIRNKTNKLLTVLSCTKYEGLVPSLEYFGRKVFAEDLSSYKLVKKNHFAYATNHIEEGSIGYQNITDEALISPMYTVFNTDNTKINDVFFYKLLKSHKLIHQYRARMEGSIDRRGGLRWEAFSSIKIRIPSIEEQIAIATILSKADNEIELARKKLDTFKRQKKGLMQQLLTGKTRVKI